MHVLHTTSRRQNSISTQGSTVSTGAVPTQNNATLYIYPDGILEAERNYTTQSATTVSTRAIGPFDAMGVANASVTLGAQLSETTWKKRLSVNVPATIQPPH